MKKIIISYPSMMLGGSTTSLLSMLNLFDPKEYDVDLALSFHNGEWMYAIPDTVRLLEPTYIYQNKKDRILHRIVSPRYMWTLGVSKMMRLFGKTGKVARQYVESKDVDFYRDIEEEYDVAIAFLEGQHCKYVANHIKARRKIAWIHIDYGSSGFDPKYDRESMAAFDKIVLVSEKCRDAFNNAFPELSDRSCVIENILSSQNLRKLAAKGEGCAVDGNKINLVTTCRVDFSSKGLDRAVSAMARLKAEGLLSNIHWYIIGDGPDRAELERLISEARLADHITLLGMQTNPYCYLKNMSLFFLPSRWEGKPMAVTEAFMLGLPALVTEYSSAHEQIRQDVDGMIVPNNTEGIYTGLHYFAENPEKIAELKKNVEDTEYSNVEEMKKIIELIKG